MAVYGMNDWVWLYPNRPNPYGYDVPTRTAYNPTTGQSLTVRQARNLSEQRGISEEPPPPGTLERERRRRERVYTFTGTQETKGGSSYLHGSYRIVGFRSYEAAKAFILSNPAEMAPYNVVAITATFKEKREKPTTPGKGGSDVPDKYGRYNTSLTHFMSKKEALNPNNYEYLKAELSIKDKYIFDDKSRFYVYMAQH